jgi:hypothetical protein
MDGDAAVEFAESRRAADDDAEPASANVPAADGCARAPRDSLGILTEAILPGERDSGAIGQQSAPRVPNRGHSLTIDHGWREVAQTALDFVERFVSPGYGPRRSSGTAPATAPESAS